VELGYNIVVDKKFQHLKKPPQIVEMNGNDTFLDVNDAHLRVTSGNVYASAFNLDQIDIVMSSNTASTVNFNNPTKAFNAASNIEVGTANLFVDTTTTRVGVGTASPATTLDVAGDLNVSGNLTIIGTRTTLDTEHLMVKDHIIELGKGNTASPIVDLGLILTRPATTSNVGIIFDESESTLEIGYTQGNASDSTITMQSAATEPLSVNVNGTLSAAKDQDVTSYLGRAAIGYNGTQSDQATFAHVDHNSDSNFAIRQTNAGKTILNSAAGERLNFNINNSTKASVESNGDFKVDTDTLYVDSVNDRVGIGTSSPLETLDVYGGFLVRPERTTKSYYDIWSRSSPSYFNYYNPITGPTINVIYSKNAIYTTTGGLKVSPPNTDFEYYYQTGYYYNYPDSLYVHFPASTSTESPYLSGDVFSSTRFKADNTEDFTGFAIGQDYEAGNSLSDYSHPLDIAKAHSAHMYFKTASPDGSLTEKMRITNTGNVGIGVANPQTNLHIESSGATGLDIYGGDTNNPYIFIGEHTSSYSRKWGMKMNYYGNSNIEWFNMAVVDDNTEINALTFRRNGNVGIGTTSPNATLHIKNETDSSGVGDVYIPGMIKKPTECLRLQNKWHNTGSGALLRFTNQHPQGTNPSTGEYNLAGIAGYDHDGSWGGGLAFYTSPGSGSGGDDLTLRMSIDSMGAVNIPGPTTGASHGSASMLYLLDTPLIKEWQWTGSTNNTLRVTFTTSELPTNCKAIYADVFMPTSSNDDHVGHALGKNVTQTTMWTGSRNRQPSLDFGNLAQQQIFLSMPGQSDNFEYYFGNWWNSCIVPLDTTNKLYHTVSGETTGTSSWIYMVIKGYFH
jgi:hypothetical protein